MNPHVLYFFEEHKEEKAFSATSAAAKGFREQCGTEPQSSVWLAHFGIAGRVGEVYL